ncbi:hypothetical protein B6U98_00235 [Thermoplasmatales archaeon ex4572_165]|nr:MAG: hypothetical protein B6U98_00235 [Thermoplasmatales archaeon ex4572_165]
MVIMMLHSRQFRLLIIFSVLLSILSFFAFITSAETIIVDIGGGGDYTSIQDAIDAANVSDIVHVNSGTYNENIIINKSLTLIGEGTSNTIINGVGSYTIKISSTNNVTISNLNINNSGKDLSPLFLRIASDCIISSNIIRNGDGNGLYLVNSNNNIIRDNTAIESNNIGIYLHNSDGNEISGNNIQNNNVNAIYLSSTSSDNYIYLNDFSDTIGSHGDDRGNNYWYYNQQGNYWDDYNDYDSDEDGIGDSPYMIDSDSQDIYPLGDFLSYNNPVAYIDSISPNPAIAGNTVSFQGHGVDDGTILMWEWSSSIDGVFGTSEDCSTSSLSSATHTIRYRVKDNHDQWSSYDERSLSISSQNQDPPDGPPSGPPGNSSPIASIVSVNPLESTQGSEVFFHGYGSGTVQEYQWTSSIDGDLSQQSSFSDTTLSIGAHTIIFKVKDTNDVWSEEDSIIIIVQEATSDNIKPISYPQSPGEGQVNVSVLLDASLSYDPDGNITTYQWDFGDNTTGTGKIISHVYYEVGEYIISLTVTDDDNAETTNTTIISIVHTPSQGNTNETDSNKDENSTPSFELISLISSLFIVLYIFNRKRYI